MSKRFSWFQAALLLMILIAFPVFMGCGDDDDDEAVTDDFGGGGGGGGGDDDDSVDDDDDDDDLIDDDDDDVTGLTIAVVHAGTGADAAFEPFLVAYGYQYVFVVEDDLPVFDFSGFEMIIALQDGGFYEVSQVTAIANSGLPVLGIYEGGAILFGKLGLFADLGGAGSYTSARLIANDPMDSLWSLPNLISMTSGGMVEMSTVSVFAYAHDMVGAPETVDAIADLWGSTDRGVLILEDRYFFWGFQYDPNSYTLQAFNLLANVINRMLAQ
jgi:hypothetical protein